jgi:hypothetical protein
MEKVEFLTLLNKVRDFEINHNFKEYFLLMRVYTELNNKVGLLNDLEIGDDNEKNIIMDDDIIKKKLYEKYRVLFDDRGYKNKYEITNKQFIFDEHIIRKEIIQLNINKAVSWDYIPPKAINNLIGKKDYDNKEENIIIKDIKQLFNEILSSNNYIGPEFNTARLVVLNKNATEVANINNIRPISIHGSLFKLLEKCLYQRLYSTIVPLLSVHQTGFIGTIGTEVNIYKIKRMLSQIKKYKY